MPGPDCCPKPENCDKEACEAQKCCKPASQQPSGDACCVKPKDSSDACCRKPAEKK